jgi:hypothetical protein
MDEIKKELTPEENQKQREEAIKLLQEKIMRASKEIDAILEREGLDIRVIHSISVVPKGR